MLPLGERWAAELRRVYAGPAQAKAVARAFDIDVRTAEAWLGGRPPGVRFLTIAWMLHGAGFVMAVLAPTPAPTEHQVQRIKRDGAALGVRLARLERSRVRETVG